MAFDERKRFTFISKGMPEETFSVVKFKGVEGISRLYEFKIALVSEDIDIDLKKILQDPVSFTIIQDNYKDRSVHGMLSQFEQLHEYDQYVFYRTMLVPKIWQVDLYHDIRLFLDKTVAEILEDVVKQAGLASADYEFKLTQNYPRWEYICQYRETNFNFISRWMEREGIFYFFEEGEEYEKVIISDTYARHAEIDGQNRITYAPPSGALPSEDVVTALTCKQKLLPKRIILKDYNYRKPSLEIKGEATVDPKGRGGVYLYGENFKTPEEGKALAKTRAQELLCREKIFHGASTSPGLGPGFIFELVDHYREGYNQRYLITSVEHEGHQSGFPQNGLPEEMRNQKGKLGYNNIFAAIPVDLQFRPERKARISRFYGTINAKVDAAGDGKCAEINEDGLYKVKLPFDSSDKGGGKASRWTRMSQPHAGFDYGIHFPLHKSTEVLLTFQKWTDTSSTLAKLFGIKACSKFCRRLMVDIPRIKIWAQRRDRANYPFMAGHELIGDRLWDDW